MIDTIGAIGMLLFIWDICDSTKAGASCSNGQTKDDDGTCNVLTSFLSLGEGVHLPGRMHTDRGTVHSG